MTQERNQDQPQRDFWNPEQYDEKHGYVWKYGVDLIALLAPKKGERILDLGCGTGHLMSQIANSGARVVGVDRSDEMIESARKAYPEFEFHAVSAEELKFEGSFDAVFSNAALHWIRDPRRAVENVWNALTPGGRFVAEMGGKGNIRQMREAFLRAREELSDSRSDSVQPWHFPSPAEYAALLEAQGFEVRYMTFFHRPTPLPEGVSGLRHWMAVFTPDFVSGLSAENKERFFTRVEELLRPGLFHDGQWIADYQRLRFAAFK